MPRIGTDEFPRVIVNDGAGHYLKLPRLTTAQRDALTAAEGMVIANSTTSTIQGYINGAWRNMDAQMLAAYLPLAGGTMTGHLNLALNKLHFIETALMRSKAGELKICNFDNPSTLHHLLVSGFTVSDIVAGRDAMPLRAVNINDNYIALKARDTGDALYEVARLQGATVAHLLLTRAKFSTGAHAADVAHRGFLYFTEGGAGVADKLYCIMKGTADTYSAVEVASG